MSAAFRQVIARSPIYRDMEPDAARDAGGRRRRQHGDGGPRRRASIDMIAGVGPLFGRSRRSNVRAKVWLNVSSWPSTTCGRSAQRDPFTPLSEGFRTVALGEVIAENAFNLCSFVKKGY